MFEALSLTPIRTGIGSPGFNDRSFSVIFDTCTPSTKLPLLVTFQTLSNPYCEFWVSHQAGVNAPRSPPKSAGLVQVPISTSPIQTVTSEGQFEWCRGASEQISKLTSISSSRTLGGNRLGKRYSTVPRRNHSNWA